ncbi:MAG: ATP-binding protein [Patescibacteria group bacterium]
MQRKYRKYALIGTSCTGKTALLKDLVSHLEEKYLGEKILAVPEAARLYFKIVKTKQPFSYQHQVKVQSLAQELEKQTRINKPRIVLTDRSVIDAVAYVHSTGDQKGTNKLIKKARSWVKTYTHLFLLDPKGVPYATDQVRKESKKTRQAFHESFLHVLPKLSVNWTLISGTKEQRLKKILKLIYTSQL